MGGLLARFPDLAAARGRGHLPARSSRHCAPARQGHVGSPGRGPHARGLRSLVEQLATRTMERRYLALVEGAVADDQGEVEAPIGRSTRTPTKMAVTASGKPARTAYTVRERRPATATRGPRPCSSSSLQSGRTHQIRVHMAAIGHPVVGDARYGAPDKRLRRRAASSCTPTSSPSPTPGRGRGWSSRSPLPGELEQYLTD